MQTIISRDTYTYIYMHIYSYTYNHIYTHTHFFFYSGKSYYKNHLLLTKPSYLSKHLFAFYLVDLLSQLYTGP